MTVYEWLLNQEELIVRSITTDLHRHLMFYKNKVLFDGHQFNNVIKNQPDFNSMQLFPYKSGSENPEIWMNDLKVLYEAYSNCYPKYSSRLNFKPADKNSTDDFSLQNFYYCKLALEAYVLFHYSLDDLIWPNSRNFFEKITEGCVIFKKDIVQTERQINGPRRSNIFK